ncbi:hypothetical protein X961_5265 [Burkholderia pseudomallei MSHR5613]|nr:hypothetical protein DO73_3370 [Burkholderia pseudomallei]KGS29788.1 hypothetical protein X941_3166 [Burkholderia pseudomallei MSHR5569]KGS42325.1 hypothetical protein X961_5265 [Burkholderia pseudomallei MSHR5613]KGS67617.1 hypothetical protein X990_3647 [Burkholderia pseudomallei MSHR4868]KGC81372.1 hypothetical protein DO71_2440 [Burkholderia pseudomallei]
MTDCILLHCRRYCNTSRNDNIPLIKQGNIDANMNGNAYLQNRRICRRNGRNFRMPTLRRRVRGNGMFRRHPFVFFFSCDSQRHHAATKQPTLLAVQSASEHARTAR